MNIKKIISSTIGPSNTQLIKSYFKTKAQKEDIRKRKSFYTELLKDGEIYFDIGANYGNRIEPIIDQDIKIVAIEPQQECVKFLKKKFGNKINVVNKGLGAKKEERTMFISSLHVLSSFSKEFIEKTKESGRFGKHDWNKEETIQITTLDEIISIFGKPSFIKIDVEGFELEVLKGLSQPIDCLSIEYAVPEQRNKLIECLDLMYSLNGDKMKCNYSIGESMTWASKDWKSCSDFIDLVKSEQFTASDFGDVYISTVK